MSHANTVTRCPLHDCRDPGHVYQGLVAPSIQIPHGLRVLAERAKNLVVEGVSYIKAGGLEVLKSGGNPQGVLEGATRHIADADGVGNVAKGGDDGVGGAGLLGECEGCVGSRGGGFQRCDRALKQVTVVVVRAGVCVALWVRVGSIRVEEQHAR